MYLLTDAWLHSYRLLLNKCFVLHPGACSLSHIGNSPRRHFNPSHHRFSCGPCCLATVQPRWKNAFALFSAEETTGENGLENREQREEKFLRLPVIEILQLGVLIQDQLRAKAQYNPVYGSNAGAASALLLLFSFLQCVTRTRTCCVSVKYSATYFIMKIKESNIQACAAR